MRDYDFDMEVLGGSGPNSRLRCRPPWVGRIKMMLDEKEKVIGIQIFAPTSREINQ